MTLDELQDNHARLRAIMCEAHTEWLRLRIEEINACTAYMRALRSGEAEPAAEAEWRFAEARLEVAQGAKEKAESDVMASCALILKACNAPS